MAESEPLILVPLPHLVSLARPIRSPAQIASKIVMYRHPTGTFPDYHRRLGSVTLTGQGLGLGLGTSLFPVGAMEIKGTVR